MKLSELVAYKNQLDLLSIRPTQDTTGQDLDRIMYTVDHSKLQMSDQLLAHKNNLIQTFDLFEQELDSLKQQLSAMITKAEKPMFQQSYSLYEKLNTQINSDQLYQDNVEYVLNRQLEVAEENYQIFLARLMTYTNWQHAGMVLHPGKESFINHMVTNDPLYIVDENYDLIKPAINQFNEFYQSRLRISTVKEDASTPWLTKIPNGQLGLCLAYNFFNYKPFEIVKQYLTEIYQKLKPGGTLIMTFNDCDRSAAVGLVERFYAAYTPGNMLRGWAKHVGFKEVFCHHNDGPSTWIELQKPGELTSLRGGQALARILPKPVAESK
jgi:hypothetical protein